MLLEMFCLWKEGGMTLQMSLYFKEANVFFSTENLEQNAFFCLFFLLVKFTGLNGSIKIASYRLLHSR